MKHVIFDFDGTIADGLPVIIELAQEMVPGFDLSKDEIEKLRNMSARQVIKYSGIPYWKLLRMLVKGKKVFAQRIAEVTFFTGMPEVIEQLYKDGYQLSIVSSNSESTIRTMLKRNKIDEYITVIYGNLGLFSKSRAFKKVLKKQRADKTNTICVGDEVRDIEAAKKTGLPIASVTWGFNGKEILTKTKPTYLVDTPKQLLKVLQEFGN